MDVRKIYTGHKEKISSDCQIPSGVGGFRGVWADSILLRSDGIVPTNHNHIGCRGRYLRLVLNGMGVGTETDRGQTEGEKIMEMKRYEFIVTLANGTTVKTVESGRTPSEAQQIVESQHSEAKNIAYRGEV